MDWKELTLPITDPTWIFLIVLLIILFAPLLFNRLRIPNIIGMILAGVLIGEHGLTSTDSTCWPATAVSSCSATWVFTTSCSWPVWRST